MKHQTNIRRLPFARILSALAVIMIVSVSGAGAVTLIPILTGLPTPIGLDHKEPQNEVLMSENYPSGMPNNFVLVNFSGGLTPFSAISGLTDEVYIATVRTSSCEGGFTVGEAFTGNGVPGQITRISPNGSTIIDPWVTLPGETGLLRGALFQDRFCSFGGDLIVTTTAGSVWRVNSSGGAMKLATVSSNGEGLTTVPNDPATYGPWAGKILVGSEGSTVLSTVDSSGSVVTYNIGIPDGESIQIIPANANFFGVNFPSTLMAAPASDFVGMVGDFTIAQESGNLWHVRWNSTTGAFDKDLLANVSQWEGTTFSPASIVGLPKGSIAGTKFNDLNGDGTRQSGEPGLANWTITLTNASGGVVTNITDASGNYNFTNLSAGNYTVGEVLKPGWTQTAPTPIPPGTYNVNLTSGENVIGKDFGNKRLPPTASCVKGPNPSGENIPPANGGQRPDGFYHLLAMDILDPNPQIFVNDTGSGTIFGPFTNGTNIKYTQAPGAMPSIKTIGGPNSAVSWHITGVGDAAVFAMNNGGVNSTQVSCLVPPPPK